VQRFRREDIAQDGLVDQTRWSSVEGPALDNQVVGNMRDTASQQVGGEPSAHHPLVERRFPAGAPPPIIIPRAGTPEPGQLGASPSWAISSLQNRCVRDEKENSSPQRPTTG
jgi:hypothetical protein